MSRKALIDTRYREATVTELLKALHWVWGTLLRKAHSTGIPERARVKLALVVGTSRLMLTLVGDPHSKYPDQKTAVAVLWGYLRESSELTKLLHVDVLFMIQVIHDRMASCRVEAIGSYRKAEIETDPTKRANLEAESKGWWAAYDVLRNCRSRITASGFLAEIPNSSQIPKLTRDRIRDYVIQLEERWDVVNRALGGPKLDAYSKSLLGQVKGLNLFRGFRAQEQEKAGNGVEGLIAYLLDDTPRNRRSWQAEIADDIAGVEELCRELMTTMRRVQDPAKLQSIRSTLRILEITIEAVLRARVFAFPQL